MKQHISYDDINALSFGDKDKLRNWLIKNHIDWLGENTVLTRFAEGAMGALPLLSIGQMIEFLTNKDVFKREYGTEPAGYISTSSGAVILSWYDNDGEYIELCDLLFEAVKKVLEADGQN